MDFATEIREITQETMHTYYNGMTNLSESHREFAERQNHLLLALLKNEDVLAKFMTYLLTDEAWNCLATDYANVFEVEEMESILALVNASLGKEDAEYFQRAKEDEIFSECTEMLMESFQVKCTSASVTEMRIVAEGDVKKAQQYVR